MEEIKKEIKNYQKKNDLNETDTPLIIMAKILIEMNRNLEAIASKMWE